MLETFHITANGASRFVGVRRMYGGRTTVQCVRRKRMLTIELQNAVRRTCKLTKYYLLFSPSAPGLLFYIYSHRIGTCGLHFNATFSRNESNG